MAQTLQPSARKEAARQPRAVGAMASLVVVLLAALLVASCGEEPKKAAPAKAAEAAAPAAAAGGGPDPVLERWEVLGENPRFTKLSALYRRHEASKIEDLANPMLSNLVDFVVKPVIDKSKDGDRDWGREDFNSAKEDDQLDEGPIDPRTKERLIAYKLIILMTGIARPKAVLTDSQGNRVEVERGDPLGSEGGRVKAILQYKILVAMPGKVEPTTLSIEPPLASLSTDGAPAAEKKDL